MQTLSSFKLLTVAHDKCSWQPSIQDGLQPNLDRNSLHDPITKFEKQLLIRVVENDASRCYS